MGVDQSILAVAFASSPTAALRVASLCDLNAARRRYSKLLQKAGMVSLIRALDPPYREVGSALLLGQSRVAMLSDQAVEISRQAAETAHPRILSEVVPLLIKAGEMPGETIRRWLNETEDKDLAEATASAAVEIEDEEAVTKVR